MQVIIKENILIDNYKLHVFGTINFTEKNSRHVLFPPEFVLSLKSSWSSRALNLEIPHGLVESVALPLVNFEMSHLHLLSV